MALIGHISTVLLVLAAATFTPTSSIEISNLSDVSCGQSQFGVQSHGRIVGGTNAEPREFPWMVSITRKGGHFCGGTILNSKFVLTAAHCFCSRKAMMPVDQLRVTVGEHDLGASEIPSAVVSGVKKMIVHQEFECGQYVSDIALLELSEEVVWSASVRPACLPPRQGSQDYSVFGGQNAVAAGWGWLGEDKSIYSRSNVLQKVGVNVIEDQVCTEWFASQGKSFKVKHGQMCAGHENGGKDSCAADSGGPLMYSNNNDQTIVIGIVSTGIGCARKRLPGVYTRVSEFIPWIIKNTQY